MLNIMLNFNILAAQMKIWKTLTTGNNNENFFFFRIDLLYL